MNCATTVEVQSGMLSRVGPGNMYLYMGIETPHERALLGCLVDWKSLFHQNSTSGSKTIEKAL